MYSSEWSLKNPVVYSHSCDSSEVVHATGHIGLSFSGSAVKNFVNEVHFAVLFDENSDNGNITFASDISNLTKLMEIPTNKDWHISGVTSVQVSNSTPSSFNQTTGSIIFDINLYSLGLPLAIYNDIMSKFKVNTSIFSSCDGAECFTTTNFISIPIPPRIYVQGERNYTRI